MTDLNGSGRRKDVGGFSHEFGGVDFGSSGDDLGFSDSLGLSGGGEGGLEFFGEDDVLWRGRKW